MNNWHLSDNGPKVVKGEVEVRHEGVNILGNGQRVGHAERQNVTKHILDVKDRGYITDQEAEARIQAALAAEKAADIKSLTADLPGPFVTQSWLQRYDWDEPKHWVPTLLSGMAVSLILAILPTAVLAQDHLFPHNLAALVFGVLTMLTGTIGFFGCIGGMIAKE